jgi:hypothetical protein
MSVRGCSLVVVLASIASGRAWGEPRAFSPVLAGRIDQMVPTSAGVAVLRDGTAWFLGRDGRVLGRCAEPAPPAAARPRARARPDGQDSEDVLRDAGFDADDDSPEAEAALDDEGIASSAERLRRSELTAGGAGPSQGPARIEPPRRRAHTPHPTLAMPRGLAAARGSSAVWIATSNGLRRARADGGGCARAALGGRDVTLVAAAGRVVVAIADATVWWSRDEGASFVVAAVLPFGADALALDEAGGVALVASADGVLELSPGGPGRRVLDRPAHAVAACDGLRVALTADGAYVWRPGDSAPTRAAGPPARALACDGDPARPWVAAGVGIWTSADGASWVEEPEGLGLSVASALRAGSTWWLATDRALLVAAPDGTAVAAGMPARSAGGLRARPPRPARSFLRALLAETRPHLALAFGGREAADTRAEWHVRLLLTVRFGHAPGRGPGEDGEALR